MENDAGERAVRGTGRAWTEFQQAAIAHGAGELLVSAAAGSGKTAVLAERCARLVCEGWREGLGVDNLLVLTFTEAAAAEMKSRIAGALEAKLRTLDSQDRTGEETRWLRRQVAQIDRASISTLHGFCARVLRQHFAAAGIDPAFEVMDGDEARLLREEVAAEVIARWHRAPPPPSADAGASFADFFEAYAQGNDGALSEMMLRLYEMLASVADPAAYLRSARRVYGEGVDEVMARWARDIVAGQVRVEALRAQRAAAEVLRRVGPGPMAEGLSRAAELLAWAEIQLAGKGCDAMAGVRDTLSYKWPTCRTVKEVADFDGLKKRTWEKVKRGMDGLCAKALAADVAAMRGEMAKLGPMLDVLVTLVEDFERTYRRAKRGEDGTDEQGAGPGRLDFADLERLTHRLLTAEGEGSAMVREELRGRYLQVLVDEFQDINPLQAAILDALNPAASIATEASTPRGGMFVVGDVKQSIYGFRLAEPALFLERERRALALAGARRGHVFLPHNFRSRSELIAVMNGVFERVMTVQVAGVAYAEGHRLEVGDSGRAASDDGAAARKPGVELRLVGVRMEEESEEEGAPPENLSAVEMEARMVARRVEEMMAEGRRVRAEDGSWRPMCYRDVAILLRTMRNKAMIFARALARRGIPAHAELSTGYFDTAEVRDVLALLEVVDNPRQDIPLATVLVGPFGRFSHDDLAIIRLAFERERVGFAEAAHRFVEIDADDERGELAGRLRTFWETIGRWREVLRTRGVHEGLAEIYRESQILAYVAGLEAGRQRVANLQALHQRALAFASFRRQGLHRFLRFIERLRDAEGDFGEAPVLSEASDVVRIMSVHHSKGLEFPVVIVAGLGSPLRLADPAFAGGGVLVHRDLGVGLAVVDVARNVYYPSAAGACIREAAKRGALAEELRLLYVAMTRARDHLVLTGHVRDEGELRTLAERGAGCRGALPEDVLVGARRPVEWVLGALGCEEGLCVRWPWQGAADGAQVEVVLEGAGAEAAEREAQQNPEREAWVRRLSAGEPIGAPPSDQMAALMQRVTGVYAHEAMTRRAAVVAVTALAKESAEQPESIAVAEWLPSAGGAGADEARLRGLATHRVLEKLDFAEIDRGALVAEAIENLAARSVITADEARLADRDGIAWLLGTETGKRIVTAAKRVKALDRGIKLRREISFAWAGAVGEHAHSAGDLQTVRGVIDLLIAESARNRAEIIDYKTDSAWTWQGNLEAYRRQMELYLRAASEILGYHVERATLVFLAAREVVEVAG